MRVQRLLLRLASGPCLQRVADDVGLVLHRGSMKTSTSSTLRLVQLLELLGRRCVVVGLEQDLARVLVDHVLGRDAARARLSVLLARDRRAVSLS